MYLLSPCSTTQSLFTLHQLHCRTFTQLHDVVTLKANHVVTKHIKKLVLQSEQINGFGVFFLNSWLMRLDEGPVWEKTAVTKRALRSENLNSAYILEISYELGLTVDIQDTNKKGVHNQHALIPETLSISTIIYLQFRSTNMNC